MRFRWVIPVFGLFTILLSACSREGLLPVSPATDKLTFLFFYTDG
jgi:hypothetical protein